jgi:hypothetical protein
MPVYWGSDTLWANPFAESEDAEEDEREELIAKIVSPLVISQCFGRHSFRWSDCLDHCRVWWHSHPVSRANRTDDRCHFGYDRSDSLVWCPML